MPPAPRPSAARQRQGLGSVAGIATEPRDLAGPSQEVLAALRRCALRLLLTESDDAAERRRLAEQLDALERRLTAVVDAAEQYLGSRLAALNPDAANALRRTASPRAVDLPVTAAEGELEGDLRALVVAVDAFLGRPQSGESLQGVEGPLQRLELRLGCSPAAPTKPKRLEPVETGPPVPSRRSLEDPRPQAPEASARWGSLLPPGGAEPARPPPAGGPPGVTDRRAAGAGAELAALSQRVRRLEVRVRLTQFLLVIAVAGLAGSLWLLQGSGLPWPPWPLLSVGRPPDLPLPALPAAEPGASAEGSRPDRAVPGPEGPRVGKGASAPMTFPDRDRPEAGTADAMREPGEPYRASTSEGAVPPVARDRVETGGAAHPVAPEGDEPAPRRDVQQDPETTEAADRPPSAAPTWSSATDPEEAPGARWAEATVLTDPAYGVQLIAFRDQGRMLDFLDKTPMAADALFSRSAVAGRAWLIVVKGLYRTRAEAERAVADLPAELKRLDPWIRRFPEGSRFFRLPP